MKKSQTTLIGNLGQDPELKQVGNTHVAKFSVATTEKYKNRDGVYMFFSRVSYGLI